jgi:hypothetical protein
MLNTRLMSDECRPHKLRPPGLGSGIDKDRSDCTVYCGEWEVGRIYETRGGPESLRLATCTGFGEASSPA